MCIVAYVGSDVPLPLCPWTEEARAFNVADLDEHEAAAKARLKRKHVYYLGSSLNCGCQFRTGAEGEEDCEPNDLEESRRDRRNLVLFLQAALRRQHSVQVLACWNGDESKPAKHSQIVPPDHFDRPGAFPQIDEVLTYEVRRIV